jgi:hypothetical protein
MQTPEAATAFPTHTMRTKATMWLDKAHTKIHEGVAYHERITL